jgi:hypothetical protein
MSYAWKIALLLAVILLFAMTVSLSWSAPLKADNSKMPVFTPKDHEVIAAYYRDVLGELAPGTIDRSSFPLGIEEALVTGSHVPIQLVKELKPLPEKVESKLTTSGGEFKAYTLGRHVLLVRKLDFAIADIIRNVAVK